MKRWSETFVFACCAVRYVGKKRWNVAISRRSFGGMRIVAGRRFCAGEYGIFVHVQGVFSRRFVLGGFFWW